MKVLPAVFAAFFLDSDISRFLERVGAYLAPYFVVHLSGEFIDSFEPFGNIFTSLVP